MGELMYHSSMLCGYYAAPALVTAAEGARHLTAVRVTVTTIVQASVELNRNETAHGDAREGK